MGRGLFFNNTLLFALAFSFDVIFWVSNSVLRGTGTNEDRRARRLQFDLKLCKKKWRKIGFY